MSLDREAIYNVILNSVNGSGTYNAQKTYNFDWSVMPHGKYRVHYTYTGKVNNIDGTKLALINVPLGNSKTFTTGSTTQAAQSNFLGALSPLVSQIAATNSTWKADDNTNAPIYLDDRPYQSSFQVDVLDGNGLPFVDATANINTSTTSTIATNILTIGGAGGAQTFRAGVVISGAGIVVGTQIIRQLTGTGGNGTYLVTTTPDIAIGQAINGTGTDLNSYNLTLSFFYLGNGDVKYVRSGAGAGDSQVDMQRRNGQYGL